MVKLFKCLPCFSLVLVGGLLSACSLFNKKNDPYFDTQLTRGWSRTTVKSSYMGYRQPATIAPVVYKDVVISGNGVDSVRAFDRKSGHELWKLEVKNGAEGVFMDPTGVYLGANNGTFYHLDWESGAVRWSYPLNSESTSAPLVQGNFIFHMAMNGSFYAMEKDSGRVLWVKTRPPKDSITVRGTTPPLFDNGHAYVGYSDGYFLSYNAADGTQAWEKRLADSKKFNDIDARPVLAGSCLLVANFSDSLYCLDKASGQIRWQSDEGGSAQPIAVSGQDVIYSTETAVLIIDLASGKTKKKFAIERKYGQPTGAVVYQNWLLFGTSEGPLVLMDKDNGQWVDTFYPGRGISAAPTVIADTGEVFLVSNQGNVYKLRVERPEHGKHFTWASR